MADIIPIDVQAQQLQTKQQQIQQQQQAFQQEQARLAEIQSQYIPKVGLTPVNVAYERQYRTQLAKTQDVQKQLASGVEQYNIGVSAYQAKIGEAQKVIEALPTTPKSESDIAQAKSALDKGYISPEEFQSYKSITQENIKAQQLEKFPTIVKAPIQTSIAQHDIGAGREITYFDPATGKPMGTTTAGGRFYSVGTQEDILFRSPEEAKAYASSKGMEGRQVGVSDISSADYWKFVEAREAAKKLAYLESPTAQWGSPEALSMGFEQVLGRPATTAELALAQYGKPETKVSALAKLESSPEAQREIARAIDAGKITVEGIKTGKEYLEAIKPKFEEKIILPSTPKSTVESFMKAVETGAPIDMTIRPPKPGEFGYHATPERLGGIIQPPKERMEVEDYYTYPIYKATKEYISEPLAKGEEQTFGRYGIPGQVAVGASKFFTSLPEFGATVGVGAEAVARKTTGGKVQELIGLAGTGVALQYAGIEKGIKERPYETAGQLVGMAILSKSPAISDVKIPKFEEASGIRSLRETIPKPDVTIRSESLVGAREALSDVGAIVSKELSKPTLRAESLSATQELLGGVKTGFERELAKPTIRAESVSAVEALTKELTAKPTRAETSLEAAKEVVAEVPKTVRVELAKPTRGTEAVKALTDIGGTVGKELGGLYESGAYKPSILTESELAGRLPRTEIKATELKPSAKVAKAEEIPVPEVTPLIPEEWYGRFTQFEISPEFSRVGVGGARERIALPEDIIKGEAPPRVRVGKETVTKIPKKEPEPTVREVRPEELVKLEPTREMPRARLPEETLKLEPKAKPEPEPIVREVDLSQELVKLEKPSDVTRLRLPEETITRPRVEPEVSPIREVKPTELVKPEYTREYPRARLAEETIQVKPKAVPEVSSVREVKPEELVHLYPDLAEQVRLERPEVFPYGRYTELPKVTDVLKTPSEESIAMPEVKIPKERPEAPKKPKPEIKQKDREKIAKPEKPEYPAGTPPSDVIDRLTRQLEAETTTPTEPEVLPEIPKVRLPKKPMGKEVKEAPKVVVKRDIQSELEKKWRERELGLKKEEAKRGATVTKEGQILLMKKPEMVAKPKPPEVEMVDLSKMEKMRSPLYVVPVIKPEVVPKRVPKYIQREKIEVTPVTREREITKQREKFVVIPSYVPRQVPSFVQVPKQIPVEVPIERYKEISLETPVEIPITRIIPREEPITEIIPKFKQEKVPVLIPERIQREAERLKHKPPSEEGVRREIKPKEGYRYKPRESPIFSGAEKLFKDTEDVVSPLGRPKKKVIKTKEKVKKDIKKSKKEFWEF